MRSVREGKKVRQRVVGTLGRRDELVASGELDGLLKSPAGFSKKLQVAHAHGAGSFRARSAKAWGPVLVVERLWRRQGFPDVVRRLTRGRHFQFDAERCAFAMTLQRLMALRSDQQGSSWVHTVEAGGVGDLAPQHFYRTAGLLCDVRVLLEPEVFTRDAQFDGTFVLTTNTRLPASEVATGYKWLWRVERAFRTEKSVLGARPLYHHTDRNSIGHIVACFLALRLEVDLQRRLDEKKVDVSWPDLMRNLAQVQAFDVEADGKRHRLRTDVAGSAPAAFAAAGVRPPTIATLLGSATPPAADAMEAAV